MNTRLVEETIIILNGRIADHHEFIARHIRKRHGPSRTKKQRAAKTFWYDYEWRGLSTRASWGKDVEILKKVRGLASDSSVIRVKVSRYFHVWDILSTSPYGHIARLELRIKGLEALLVNGDDEDGQE